MVLNTRVHAEKHGPSITTRSPERFMRANISRKSDTRPPELDTIRTSAREIGGSKIMLKRNAITHQLLSSMNSHLGEIQI
jgi:hypothetical protein